MSSPAPPDGFATMSRDDWAAAVAADMGQDVLTQRLRFLTEDGVELDALQSAPGVGPELGCAVSRLVAQAREAHGWPGGLGVRQLLDASAAAVGEVTAALAGGADSVELDLAGVAPEAIEAKLGVLTPPVLGAARELSLAAMPMSAWDALRPALEAGTARIVAGLDPFAAWAATSRAGQGPPALDGPARVVSGIPSAESVCVTRASAVPWFDAGASVGWSLAIAIAAGLEYVRALERAGLPIEHAARQVELELALGADLFEGVAAVRSARLLWARALEVLGVAHPPPLRLAATAGRRILTRRDPWTNALRETAVTFAAAIGGADLVALPPFDERTGASAPARRLARNTVLVLREEAGLARVDDPAAGAWYLDAATAGLAEHVWAALGEIDQAGGLAAALDSGLISQRLAAQRATREDAVRRRRRPITGVSEFPERRAGRAPAIRQFTPPPSRFEAPADSEPFERLQDAADSHAAARRARAKVLLVRLGSRAESAPRAAFARGVVATGGLDSMSIEAESASHVAAAVEQTGASVALLCGADARYVSEAAPLASALKAAGVRLILVAGRPGDNAAVLREAGVDEFVHAGADVVAVLERMLRATGALP